MEEAKRRDAHMRGNERKKREEGRAQQKKETQKEQKGTQTRRRKEKAKPEDRISLWGRPCMLERLSNTYCKRKSNNM